MSNSVKDLLILAAHPDDETLGCGATIAKLSHEGFRVELIVFTDGVSSRNVTQKNRKLLLEKVCGILGVHRYECGNFPDNAMDSIPLLNICKFIEKKVLFQPSILTHHPECLNVDHKIVYNATLTVFRPTGKNSQVYSYFVPSSTDYNPLCFLKGNVYFDIKNFVENKISALKIYNNEMRDPPHSRSYDNILNLMKTNGSEAGLEFAEKFYHVRSVFK